MSLIEAEHVLAGIFNSGKVRRKINVTGHLAKTRRIVGGSPEVMVKITGFGKGSMHVRAHLSYITRNARLALETDRGEILRDKDAVTDLFKIWREVIDSRPRHKNQRDTVHLVLSMPEGTPETAVRNAARAYAKRTFGTNHEYVFALHTDEPHPHVHLTVRMRGADGKMLNPRKNDLQTWREAFARDLRDEGIEAEATPRWVRGVVRKAEKSVVRHIERGDDRRSPRVSVAKAARVKDAAAELIAQANGRYTREKPWETRIGQRQLSVRQAWLSAAVALQKNASRYQEHPNVPPEYDNLDTARVRAGHRAAAIYQSNSERHGFRPPAVALARMRDVSRLDMVQHQRPAQVLLHANAPDGMGRYGTADHDLRWPRTCALTIAARAGSTREDRRVTGDAVADRDLPRMIESFVHTMPPVETERGELRRALVRQFGQAYGRDQGHSIEHEIATRADGSRKSPER